MKATHVALPVRVSAVQIQSFAEDQPPKALDVIDEHGIRHTITEEMMSRYSPVEGDYIVTQEDGYVYINPREVFERKYQAIGQRVRFHSEVNDLLNRTRTRIGGELETDALVVVHGSVGGKIYVESVLSSIDTVGFLEVGKQIMLNTIMPNGNIEE